MATTKRKIEVWYNECRANDSLNEVDLLMLKDRIIPSSCLDMRDARLINFQPCNPGSIHSHEKWRYDYSAWDTVQRKGHSGTGGSCLDLGQTCIFEDVVKFYNKHKDAKYCCIDTAASMHRA